MSIHRLASCRNLGAARSSIKFTSVHLVRWQSASSVPKRGGALKKILAGLTVTGLAAGGALAYANYNPVFKNQVNERIPGFALWTDKAADVWVEVTDYFSSKPSPKPKSKDDFVYEYNQAKVRQSELKKKQEQSTSSKTPEATKQGVKSGPVSSAQSSEGGKGAATRKEDSATVKGKVADVKEAKKDSKKDDVSLSEKTNTITEPASPKPSSSEASSPPVVEASAPPVVEAIPTSPSSTPETSVTKAKAGQGNMEQSESKEMEPVEAEEVTDVATQSQAEVTLMEMSQKFQFDADRILAANKCLMKALEPLLTARQQAEGTERDRTITEGKEAVTSAQKELIAAVAEYDVTNRLLKELVDEAPKAGCKAEATESVVEAMRAKEGELLFSELLLNALTSGAKMMLGPGEEQFFKNLNMCVEPGPSSVEEGSQRAESLERELKASELEHARYVMLALEVQRRSLEQLAEKRLQEAAKESEAKYQQQLGQEINRLADGYNSMLTQRIQLVTESHAKEMSGALKDQADKLDSEWSSKMDIKLAEQQGFYQTELAKARARLFGLEAMVEGIASAGEKTLQLQSLRNSCDILASALDRADVDSDATDHYTIGGEVDAMYRVAGDEAFLTTVLNSIPTQATAGAGIQSEASLKERFRKVKRVCGRVALVPETGGGLGLHALSFLQSAFTIRVPPWLSKAPADQDPSEMHTYDLLEMADTRMQKGDLVGAVYYLNYLQGEPKNIARDWLKDARLYLETRQAIELVQAYMFASGAVTNQ